jgi:hypothetical protein
VQAGGSDDRLTVAPADAVQATMTVKAALTMRSVLVCRSGKILHSRCASPCAPWADRPILLERQSYAHAPRDDVRPSAAAEPCLCHCHIGAKCRLSFGSRLARAATSRGLAASAAVRPRPPGARDSPMSDAPLGRSPRSRPVRSPRRSPLRQQRVAPAVAPRSDLEHIRAIRAGSVQVRLGWT